jgi:katanin p60 ATPase-containing subunit A1
MILILEFLNSNGYYASCSQLENEAGINMKKYCVADNMDLSTILKEYETYYNIKFGKQPKITRKLTAAEIPAVQKKQQSRTSRRDSENFSSEGLDLEPFIPLPKIKRNSSVQPLPKDGSAFGSSTSKNTAPPSTMKRSGSEIKETADDVGIIGTSAPLKKHQEQPLNAQEVHDETPYDNKLLKPMPGFGNAEFRELATIISRDIFMHNPNVHWSDIAGLEDSKRLIKEAVVFPMRYPELFTGILTPWKGLLLYGPVSYIPNHSIAGNRENYACKSHSD